MKLSVGYSLIDRERFLTAVNKYCRSIEEIYFGWPNIPSGRGLPVSNKANTIKFAQHDLQDDLGEFRQSGIKLNLLLNGNCYGEGGISEQLKHLVLSLIDHLGEVTGGIDSITTCSPFIAHIVKKHFPVIEVRASVNMRIGTIPGLNYLKDHFDSFCLQREFNRDFKHLDVIRQWAIHNHKKLSILVNSGCFNYCSNQTFHDNLVAHEDKLSEIKNDREYNPIMCRRYITDPQNHISLLKDSNWIRPEDLTKYEKWFDIAKLATRLHPHPGKVFRAYSTGKFSGNLLDLLEPNLSSSAGNISLNNENIPSDWLEKINALNNDKCRNQFLAKLFQQCYGKANML